MIAPQSEEQQPVTWDFNTEKACYDKLISGFSEEKLKVATRRTVRENRKNVAEEQQKGTILPDETIIPDRTINTNIRRGKAPYIAYITQAKNLVVITEIDKPDVKVLPLEVWFTRGQKYPKWKLPWLRGIDAFHLHGGVAMEVMYDPTKPLNNTLDYIPRDSLIFPLKTRNIQACPRILRSYELTTLQLEEFTAQYGFDQATSTQILDKFRKTEDFITVYRGLCKKDGIVYNFWYSRDCNNAYLKDPTPHDIGLFDFDPNMLLGPGPDGVTPLFLSREWDEIPVNPMDGMPFIDPNTQQPLPSLREQMATPLKLKEYPIYWISYEITENEEILAGQGRAALDIHVQEALTHVVTNTVNATTRASHLYGSAENLDGMDATLGELAKIKPGLIMSRKINLFQPPWPSNIILAVSQALRMDKANEAGQTDYAATARKDANKTATEMELATEQAQTIVSSDMDIFSSPVLDIFALQFKIACHQAIFGLCKRPENDPTLLLGDYNIMPAGDTEVVKRAEDKASAKEFFNIVQGTPAAEKVLTFLIRAYFPDQADEWIAALTGPDKDAIISQLIAVLQTIPTDELPPAQKSALANVIAVASSVVAPLGDEGLLRQSGQNPGQQPPPSYAEQQAPA